MKKKLYDSLDEAYKELVGPLTEYARKHLANKDLAIDAVHDAFQKRIEYELGHPGIKTSRYLMYRETIRACRRINRKEKELLDLMPAFDTGRRVVNDDNQTQARE